MPRPFLAIALLLAALVAAALFYTREQAPLQVSVGIGQALAGDTTGYARAYGPVPIQFPADHGPHPAFKLEWWYYTGNLQTDAGRRFGYQFTVFRNALAPPDTTQVVSASDWRTEQLYFAHFTLSDIDAAQFHAFERFSRGAAGLAGAQPEPFKVWLEDWQATEGTQGMPAMQIRAEEGGVAIDLGMQPVKPTVLQGEEGFSIKGPGAGNASYYYSMTRLQTTGTVTVAGETFAVDGLSWMDREWSTSLLAEDQEGWDWFSLHLDDGRDLMYFNVRSTSAPRSPYADGALIAADGQKQALEPAAIQLEVLDTWESPRGGVYPSRWRMQVPGEAIDLYIEPFFENQELDLAIRYWEGAVRVTGSAGGQPLSGTGYVELTGYDPTALQFTD